jgi:putative acetyltransferase
MIRPAGPGDLDATWDIYRDAILNGTAPFYTAAQAAAWVGPDERPDWWGARMAAATTWIGEDDLGAAGFISLADPAHLDFFFVRPRARGTGLAHSLYERFVEEAAARDGGRMTTFASHLARRFLEPRGWVVTEEQIADRGGERLVRFAMERAGDQSRLG